jgi:hypothetical protein
MIDVYCAAGFRSRLGVPERTADPEAAWHRAFRSGACAVALECKSCAQYRARTRSHGKPFDGRLPPVKSGGVTVAAQARRKTWSAINVRDAAAGTAVRAAARRDRINVCGK